MAGIFKEGSGLQQGAQPQLRAGKPREWFEKLMREEPKFERKEEPRPKITEIQMRGEQLDQLKKTPNTHDIIAFLDKYWSVFNPKDIAELLIDLACRNNMQANARDVLAVSKKLPHKLRISMMERFISDEKTYRLEFAKEAVVLGMGDLKLLKKIIAGAYGESSFEGTKIKEFFDNENDRLTVASYVAAGLASSGLFAIFYFEKMAASVGAFVILDLVVGAIGSYIAGGIVELVMMGLGKIGLGVARICRFAGSSVWWTANYASNVLKPKRYDLGEMNLEKEVN